jgi:glycosyltransferase involved in cell wall biosynthesis
MLYICDFFTRHKEAVSNQIELLARNQGGTVIAATRFMGQKPLRSTEIRDNIILLPDLVYKVGLPLILALKPHEPIHYFEEEPSTWKRILFNRFNRPLYISMYRRPTSEYADHLKKYRNLHKVFVELDRHKDILVKNGISSNKIHVSYTPAKLAPHVSTKQFVPSDVSIIFASWNMKEGDALKDRGLLYLLDLLKVNPGFKLEVVLRDDNTQQFLDEAKCRNVESRVTLTNIRSESDLIRAFERCDFVAFPAQKRVVKDVPNSLLDGLMFGKPSLLTGVIDFSEVVSEQRMGIVIPAGEKAKELKVTAEQYLTMSKNAYDHSKRHTPESYLQILNHYEVQR